MRGIASQPRGIAWLARALGLDSNPLCRASDRAEAWIRVVLAAVFLIAGPLAALDAGRLAYQAGMTRAPVQVAQTHLDKAVLLQPSLAATGPARANESRGAETGMRREGAGSSDGAGAVLAGVTILASVGLALLGALRLTEAFLNRLRLTAWETAWSRVGPRWTRGRF